MKLKKCTLVLMAALLCACGGKPEEPAQTVMPEKGTEQAVQTDDGRLIGISMPDTELERWERDAKYLEREFRDRGYDVILDFGDNDPEKQADVIKSFIDKNVDLILVTPVEKDSLTEVLDSAAKNEIPVVSYDRLIMGTDAVSYYVSFDNYEVGQIQGEYIRDALQLDSSSGPFNLEIVSGDMGDLNAGFFYKGAMDVLSPYIDSGKLNVPSGLVSAEETAIPSWDTETAKDNFSERLSEYYSDGTKLDAVLCANDSTAYGVEQAIEAGYSGGSVVITGQDGDELNLANIVDGKQSMTVYKDNYREAMAAYGLCVAVMNNQTPDERIIRISDWDFECKYNTEDYDNGKGIVPSFLLTPVLVTKDTMQKELIDTGFYTLDDKGYPHQAADYSL